MTQRDSAAYSVRLSTPLGSIRGTVEVDTGPMRLADLVPTAFALTDILVSRANKAAEKTGRPITCRSGCGICCCQMVPLSPPEVFYLADYIGTLPSEQRKTVTEKFELIVKELDSRSLISRLLDPEYSDAPVLAVAKEYFTLQLPCPFLVEGSCSIYEHRPVACREYNVTSPPECCRDPYQFQVDKVAMPLPLSASLSWLTADLNGSSPRLIPLGLLLNWSSEQQELGQRSWPGLELFHSYMKRIGQVEQEE
jgi:Fe-S-cluster containining protein